MLARAQSDPETRYQMGGKRVQQHQQDIRIARRSASPGSRENYGKVSLATRAWMPRESSAAEPTHHLICT
jgi:hypothetical protein